MEKLFESVPKVRILRLFMQNPENYFSLDEITLRSQAHGAIVKKELEKFIKLGLIQRKRAVIRFEKIKRGKQVFKTKKIIVYFANPRFEFLSELRELITRATVASRGKLLKKMKRLGRVKLAVIAGILINKETPRVDLLMVGDKIPRAGFERFLSEIESELGKSLRYALMDTQEFQYRRNMYDRFLRDILEYPHEKLINKVNA